MSNDLLPLNLNEYSDKQKKHFFVKLEKIYLNDNRLLVDMLIGWLFVVFKGATLITLFLPSLIYLGFPRVTASWAVRPVQ